MSIVGNGANAGPGVGAWVDAPALVTVAALMGDEKPESAAAAARLVESSPDDTAVASAELSDVESSEVPTESSKFEVLMLITKSMDTESDDPSKPRRRRRASSEQAVSPMLRVSMPSIELAIAVMRSASSTSPYSAQLSPDKPTFAVMDVVEDALGMGVVGMGVVGIGNFACHSTK